MLDPLVRLDPVKRELEDREEEAPDEDVLLAARNLDAVHLVGPRVVPHAAQYLAGEGHLGAGDVASPLIEREVDLEVEVRVAVEQGADAIVHLHRLEAREEARIRVERQLPLAVIREIVVPHEQVLGEGVEVECVALFGLAIGVDDFAEALEGRGQPCLARSVVGVKQDELLVLQLLPQVCSEGVEVRERRCVAHDSLPVQRGKELQQQTLLVLLERVELAGLCVELIVDGGQAVGDLLLLGQSSSVWR